jgi:hypothetical protein
MLAMRALALIWILASGCFRGSYDYTIRIGAGATDTTRGEVGGRIEVALGVNAHASGRHYVAVTGRGGLARAGDSDVEPTGGIAAEWMMRRSRLMHRIGLDYGVMSTFDGDTRQRTGGLRGALLVAVSTGEGEPLTVGSDKPGWGSGGSLGNDAESRSTDAQGRLSLGVEFGAGVVASGDASTGRGLGYAGLVLQYDILHNPR